MRTSPLSLLVLLTFFLTACTGDDPAMEQTSNDSGVDENAQLITWFDARFAEELAFSPTRKTILGIRDADYGKLDDFSDAAYDQFDRWLAKSAQDLTERFDYAALSPQLKESWDLWLYRAEQSQMRRPYRDHSYLFTQFGGIHGRLPQLLIAFHGVDSESDMRAYITRIQATPRAVEQLINRARRAAERGIRPPRFAYEQVAKEIQQIIAGAPFATEETEASQDNAVWKDAQAKINALLKAGTIDSETAEVLRNDTKDALLNHWRPAYETLLAWLAEDQPKANASAQGVHALPDGLNYYATALKLQTTTSLTAEQIHQRGLADVTRLHEEMRSLLPAMKHDGTLQEFFEVLRTSKDNPDLYFPDTDAGRQAYIDEATNAISNIREQLDDYFGLQPRAPLEVRRVEAFREQPGAAQHYFPPALDGSRPGIYYAHLSDMSAMPRIDLEVIAYHEGIPGHHMQIALAQELTGLPKFRSHSRFTAYSEGWALYAELLSKEIPGTYTTAQADFGRLASELWRAVRLVVDTGLHAYGWSEDEAMAYIQANTPSPSTRSRSEIRRYLVAPGQATTYKVGMQEIQDLRAMAESNLAEDFSLPDFHDQVLGGGALPLHLLRAKIEQWIAAQQ